LPPEGRKIQSITLSDDDRRAVVSSDGAPGYIWDVQGKRKVSEFRDQDEDLGDQGVFSGDSRRYATGGVGGQSNLWDAVTGTYLARLAGEEGATTCARSRLRRTLKPPFGIYRTRPATSTKRPSVPELASSTTRPSEHSQRPNAELTGSVDGRGTLATGAAYKVSKVGRNWPGGGRTAWVSTMTIAVQMSPPAGGRQRQAWRLATSRRTRIKLRLRDCPPWFSSRAMTAHRLFGSNVSGSLSLTVRGATRTQQHSGLAISRRCQP
jgi:hypothetical protein